MKFRAPLPLARISRPLTLAAVLAAGGALAAGCAQSP